MKMIAALRQEFSRVEPGEYTLVSFPLKIAGGDGAPTRAVLLGD